MSSRRASRAWQTRTDRTEIGQSNESGNETGPEALGGYGNGFRETSRIGAAKQNPVGDGGGSEACRGPDRVGRPLRAAGARDRGDRPGAGDGLVDRAPLADHIANF